jgi:hypothetical protein
LEQVETVEQHAPQLLMEQPEAMEGQQFLAHFFNLLGRAPAERGL